MGPRAPLTPCTWCWQPTDSLSGIRATHLRDDDRRPDHVRQPELRRGQPCNLACAPRVSVSSNAGWWGLTEDVQPADEPADDGAVPGRAELRGRGIEPAAGREGADDFGDARACGRKQISVSLLPGEWNGFSTVACWLAPPGRHERPSFAPYSASRDARRLVAAYWWRGRSGTEVPAQ